jgi:hypothetical protein
MKNLTFSTIKSIINRHTHSTVAATAGVLMTLATSLSLPIITTAAPVSSLPDGTYLYGESEQPNQPGSTYFIFEVKKGEVSGALYSPNSSFDCTHGKFEPQQIALTVVDTYEKNSYPIDIATAYSGIIANAGDPVAELGLDGMTRVTGEISARDREILSTCKAYFAKNKTVK